MRGRARDLVFVRREGRRANISNLYSNLYWQNSIAMDRRIWIAPRIFAPPTFESYSDGRDPALEAALDFGNRP